VLDLQLDVGNGGVRRQTLESELRSAIRSGRLVSGAGLPSTRALAADLGVARSTVVAAYEQLCAEGYLIAARGSGTIVADVRIERDEHDEPDPFGPAPLHDFRPGEPDASSFPRQAWMRSLRRVVTQTPDASFGYPDPRGVLELRHAMAGYLARTRTVEASTAAVHIVGGFAAGLGFIGDALRRSGVRRIAVEDPSLPFHVDVLRLAGLRTVAVPVDAEGIDVDHLEHTDVGAVVTTPAHQYPTGATMSAARRADLIAWARRCDAWVVEDDYDGEFRYDRRPIGALQGLAPDRVIYSGTASKALAPALRLGWLVVPEGFRPDMLRSIHARGGVSAIEQLALADFVGTGALDRHVRQMRNRYRDRSERVRGVLAAAAPWLDVAPSSAGLQLMARLGPHSPTEGAILAAADTASVGLLGLQTHHGATTTGPGLSIGFSRPAEHHFPTALARLGDLLASL
jgi:GntR family transcriptional regulator/MocR family aminotransferase